MCSIECVVAVSVFLLCVLFYVVILFFFFFKQKTAYEMRISDWSSDVCSSDLVLAKFKKLAENLQSNLISAQENAQAGTPPAGVQGGGHHHHHGDRKSVV